MEFPANLTSVPSPMPDNLAIPVDEIREMGRAAMDLVTSYYATLAGRPVVQPITSAELRRRLDEALPQAGSDFHSLLETIRDVVFAFSRHNGHARFFGYVSSPGTPVTAMGSLISSTLNVNVTCWRSGPAATELELLTVRWLKEMLGYPAHAAGLLVSGGSMANFAGLAAARSAKAPADVVCDGMAAAGARMCVYVSEEGHFSVRKAAAMLGIGAANVRSVKTDRRLRMDLADLDRVVREDRAAGHFALLPGGQRRHRGQRRLRPHWRPGRFRPPRKPLAARRCRLRRFRRAGAFGPPVV
jgi:aromatic-L-amino-acid/L-tryptophan decarboxylase